MMITLRYRFSAPEEEYHAPAGLVPVAPASPGMGQLLMQQPEELVA